MNSIIPHQFNGKTVQQLAENTIINGAVIPRGYVNATQMCQANGKRWVKYMEFSKTLPFLEALEKVSPSEGLTPIISITEGLNEYRGTWVNFPIATNLAQWCSPTFAAWASIVLSAVLNSDYQALTKEAAIAQAKLQEQWQKIRNASKEAFWSLGDATKQYSLNHPERSPEYHAFLYCNCQKVVNRGLFGKSACDIREELGVKDLLRDHYGDLALRRLDLVQSLASASIMHRDIEPMQAIKEALTMYNFEAMDYHD